MHQMKIDQIQNATGLREINLSRNKISDVFVQTMVGCLKFDTYLKVFNLSHNKINNLKKFSNQIMKVNQSLLAMDIRFNPGTTDKIVKMNALSMLRNISDMQSFGIDINQDYLIKSVLYHKDIPKNVYSSVGLSFPDPHSDVVKLVKSSNQHSSKLLMRQYMSSPANDGNITNEDKKEQSAGRNPLHLSKQRDSLTNYSIKNPYTTNQKPPRMRTNWGTNS